MGGPGEPAAFEDAFLSLTTGEESDQDTAASADPGICKHRSRSFFGRTVGRPSFPFGKQIPTSGAADTAIAATFPDSVKDAARHILVLTAPSAFDLDTVEQAVSAFNLGTADAMMSSFIASPLGLHLNAAAKQHLQNQQAFTSLQLQLVTAGQRVSTP